MMGRKTTLAIANIAVGTLLGLVAQKLIALYWGPNFSGQFTGALSLVGLTFFITDLGMGQAHVKRVSEGRNAGDCFATFAVFKLVSTGVFVVLVGAGLWGYTTFVGTLEDTTTTTIALIVFYYVAKSLQEIGQSSFEARLETAKLQAAAFADTFVRVVLTVILAFFVAAALHGSGPFANLLDPDAPILNWIRADPAAFLALAQLLGGVAAAGVALFMLARIFENGRFSWPLLKDYWSFALPLFITSALSAVTANIDGAILILFLDDVQTGIFGRVRAIVLVIAGLAPVVGSLLFPTFSGLASRGQQDQIAPHMDHAIRYMSMLLAPMVAFIVFFADRIIVLALSDAFVPGATAMGLLAVYVYLMTIAAPHANLVMGMGAPRLIARVGIVTALSVVIGDLLLVPDDIQSLGIRLGGFGIEGAALGTLASGVIYFALASRASYKVAGYRQRAQVVRHVAAALVMVGILTLVDERYALLHWYDFLAYTAAGGIIYFAMLVALRGFTRRDWNFVRESVHPIEMLRYVRDELRHKKGRE